MDTFENNMNTLKNEMNTFENNRNTFKNEMNTLKNEINTIDCKLTLCENKLKTIEDRHETSNYNMETFEQNCETFDQNCETFDQMLDNLYSNLELKNCKLDIVLPTPVLVKSGNKTIWRNVKDFLKLFNRDPNHFLHFINVGTSSKVCWLSDSTTDGCIFESKTKKEYIFDIMKKYIKENILCKSCKNIDTVLEKNKELRKYNLKCNNCKNEYFI